MELIALSSHIGLLSLVVRTRIFFFRSVGVSTRISQVAAKAAGGGGGRGLFRRGDLTGGDFFHVIIR